jgi:hypothetical protein
MGIVLVCVLQQEEVCIQHEGLWAFGSCWSRSRTMVELVASERASEQNKGQVRRLMNRRLTEPMKPRINQF